MPGFIVPEFIASALRRFLRAAAVKTLDVEPGSPWEHGYAESFHGRLGDELHNAELFANLPEARPLAEAWKNENNHRWPHSSLGYQTPAAYGASLTGPAEQDHALTLMATGT